MALSAVGLLDTGRGEFTAPDLIERAYVLARDTDDEVATAHAATSLAELRLVQQRFDEARELLVVALTTYEAVRLFDGAAYALEPAAVVAAAAGSSEDATRLLGAADALRSEAGVPIWGRGSPASKHSNARCGMRSAQTHGGGGLKRWEGARVALRQRRVVYAPAPIGAPTI
jgi:hypothetical protein